MSTYGLKNGYGIDGTKTNAGESTNPWAVNDVEDLNAIGSGNWGADKYYYQTDDIELNANKDCDGFLGDYNGRGYAIDGVSSFYIRFSYGDAGSSPTKLLVHNCNFKNLTGAETFGSNPTIQNCIFDTCTFSNTGTQCGLCWYTGYLTNVIAKGCTFNGKTGSTRANAVFVCGYTGSMGDYPRTVVNCVAVSCTVTVSTVSKRIVCTATNSTLTNNYASSDTTPTSSSTDANGVNGATITSDNYNDPDWWEDTALYDFSSSGSWTWDSTTSFPKLKTPSLIPTIKVYNSSTSSWTDGVVKVYDSSSSSWKTASHIYVYSNGSWVEKT